jgi:hypothetical protein
VDVCVCLEKSFTSSRAALKIGPGKLQPWKLSPF